MHYVPFLCSFTIVATSVIVLVVIFDDKGDNGGSIALTRSNGNYSVVLVILTFR